MIERVLLHVPVFVSLIDRDDRLVWVNRHIEERNGIQVADVRGLLMRDLWPDSEQDAANRVAVLRQGGAMRRVLPTRTRGGEPIWIDCTLQRHDSGVLAICTDVTASLELAAIRSLVAHPQAILQTAGIVMPAPPPIAVDASPRRPALRLVQRPRADR